MHHTPTSSCQNPVSADAHPDAALLALGREFDACQAKWLELIPAAKAARRSVETFLAECKSKNGRYTEAEYEAAWNQPGVDEADEAEDEALCDIEALIRQIYNYHPLTMDGLAIKARIVSVTYWKLGTYENDAALGANEDWPGCLIRDLIESVCALAGVNWKGQAVRRALTAFAEADGHPALQAFEPDTLSSIPSEAAPQALDTALPPQMVLPPAGSIEARISFWEATKAVDEAVSQTEVETLRIGTGSTYWTPDRIEAALSEDWSRFTAAELEVAQTKTVTELSELLPIALRRWLRRAEAARDRRWRELYALAYPDVRARKFRCTASSSTRRPLVAAE